MSTTPVFTDAELRQHMQDIRFRNQVVDAFDFLLATHTTLPNSKLFTWMLTLEHVEDTLKNRIATLTERNLSASYDQLNLEVVQDMLMFFSMSHAAYMDSLGTQFNNGKSVVVPAEVA